MLLNSSLKEFLLKVEKEIHNLKDAYVELFEEELLAEDRLNIRLRIRMDNGSLLELNEAVLADGKLLHSLGYRYHFQDGRNNLIFRYDNTPHFLGLLNFPNHKHIPDGVAGAEKPNIIDVIKEASTF
jgi:hypothetical protein